MFIPANVAIPETAASVAGPESVPLPAFVPIATATLPPNPVAVLPSTSWAVTWIAGLIAVPAVALLGCTVNTSWVAAPATAAMVVVPDSVPPLGLVPIATVTLLVNPVAVFPWASRAVTWTAGVMAAPAVALVGCAVKASCVAAPGAMLNPALVAPV